MKTFDKTFEGVYRWKGNGTSGSWESSCRLRIFDGPKPLAIVVVSDIPRAEGTSITNCAEFLATKVVAEFGVNPLTTVWAEHYPHPGGQETYDEVVFDWDKGRASSPRWKPLEKKYIDMIANEDSQ
jgi:hypothetical protein